MIMMDLHSGLNSQGKAMLAALTGVLMYSLVLATLRDLARK